MNIVRPHVSFRFDKKLPSREALLACLRQSENPLSIRQIGQYFHLKKDLQALEQRLHAMLKDGLLRCRAQGWSAKPTTSLITGTVTAHRDGFGFVQVASGPDYYLPHEEMLKVMPGDKVAIRLKQFKRRTEAVIVEVLEHQTQSVVGQLREEQGQYVVYPENPKITQKILVSPKDCLGARRNQIVVVSLIQQPTRYTFAQGKVVEVLGDRDDPGMEIEIAVRQFDVPAQFSEATLATVARLPDHVVQRDLKDRHDLRDMPFVTIDGEDARDFDDAVLAQPTTHQGQPVWRLWVAIADVSHYVKEKTDLDNDAYERGTSVYFPRRVIPMLPEKLSNGLCSLNPAVDRLVLVCDMLIDQHGQVAEYSFYPAVIHSHARLTYNQVWDLLSTHGKHPQIAQLEHLYGVYQVLAQARQQRGAVDFETTETKIIFDDDNHVQDIQPVQRNTAHKIIEEAMLVANTCAAHMIESHQHRGLYRVHAAPSDAKLADLRAYLKPLGLHLGGADEPTGQDFMRLFAQIEHRADKQSIQMMCLRSMSQAIYASDNIGHFGLMYEQYTHFTSPIRRYPDLLTHRVIKALLKGKKYHTRRFIGQRLSQDEAWEQMGMHTSMVERRADEASRDVVAWLKCCYMHQFIGQTFTGTITSLTSFGMFVTLDDHYVDGMVHISSLGKDYFDYIAERQILRGQATGQQYRLMDKVQVKVVHVDLTQRRIDLQVVSNRRSKAKSTSSMADVKQGKTKVKLKSKIKPKGKPKVKSKSKIKPTRRTAKVKTKATKAHKGKKSS